MYLLYLKYIGFTKLTNILVNFLMAFLFVHLLDVSSYEK